MKNTIELKLMIIDNFIEWWTSDESERERMQNSARLYVQEDHCDEIKSLSAINTKNP